jgi:hypothetical protein
MNIRIIEIQAKNIRKVKGVRDSCTTVSGSPSGSTHMKGIFTFIPQIPPITAGGMNRIAATVKTLET